MVKVNKTLITVQPHSSAISEMSGCIRYMLATGQGENKVDYLLLPKPKKENTMMQNARACLLCV